MEKGKFRYCYKRHLMREVKNITACGSVHKKCGFCRKKKLK